MEKFWINLYFKEQNWRVMGVNTVRNQELDEEFIRITILTQKAYGELDKHT